MELNIDDLAMVWDEVFDIQAKCYDLGVMLKVPVAILDSIKVEYSKPSDQLREILKAWLRKPTQQTWQTLANALKSRIVGEQQLARTLEEKYSQNTPGRQVMLKNTQLQQELTELRHQLQAMKQPQKAIERLEQQLQDQQRAIEAGERVQKELNHQLKVIAQVASQPRETDKRKQKQQRHLHAEAGQKQQQQQLQVTKRTATQPWLNVTQQENTLKKLNWWDCPEAPEAMYRGSVATDGTTAYFNGFNSTTVHQYSSDSHQWSLLPDLPHTRSTLVIADSKLTSVGGYLKEPDEATNSLFSLMGEGTEGKWSPQFPPMGTKRWHAAVVCNGCSLIIAGGLDGHSRLATVEVLDIDTHQWSTASSLPHPFSWATMSICGERLYMLGGLDQTGWWTHSVLTCSIPELFHSCQTPSESTMWQRIADAPYIASSCATLCEQLIVMGKNNEDTVGTSSISIYNASSNSWQAMEDMTTPRCLALVASFHDNTLMVVGGSVNYKKLDTVEIAKVL